jgi:transcriptional regulator with XRE-family HTH domain
MVVTGTELKQARKQRGWTQAEASRRLKVTQAYVSMMERDRRPLSPGLARRAFRRLSLAPTGLPFWGPEVRRETSEHALVVQLASLGYPGFAYLRERSRWNPAELLMAMLARPQLSARTVEGLPWLPRYFPDMDWEWAVRQAKLDDTQNRLGFVVRMSQLLAADGGDDATVGKLEKVLATLRPCRLAKEDTLCHDNMTQVERRWLRDNRTAEAREWNLLTDMKPEFLENAV